MTREEALKTLKDNICGSCPYLCSTGMDSCDIRECDNRNAIKVLEQEPCIDDMSRFARWVATEIFDDMWEYNKDAFAEIACRKLAKLGIVRAKGDEWELVEPQESEVIK